MTPTQVPKATLDKAIKGAKNAGELNSEFIYEVRGPGRVAILVECLVKKRTYMPVGMESL